MSVTYLPPKLLVALSSAGLGSVSTAATPVTTLNTSALDTGRRVAIFSTAGSTSMAVTVTGIIEGGGVKTEVIIGSSSANTQINSIWDYTSLLSVTTSSAPNIVVNIGTSSMAGTPWRLTDWNKTPQDLSGQITFSTSANGMTGRFDVTLDDPTFVTGRASPITVPTVFNSTSLVGVQASTNSFDRLAVNPAGTPFPIAAWRLTITSSSTSAGSVSGAVFQGGV
jgi:hypothetical protein